MTKQARSEYFLLALCHRNVALIQMKTRADESQDEANKIRKNGGATVA
jgi:hypothetical protein